MDRSKVDPGTEMAGRVRSTLCRQTVLTSCVLAGCLALIVLLVVF